MTSTIQNGEGERLAQARAIVKRHYPEMAANYTGRRVQIALDALAREPATADVERVASLEQWLAAADALDRSQEDEDADTSVHVEAVATALGVRRPSPLAVLNHILASPSSEPAIAEGERVAKRIGAVEINMNFDVRSLIEEFAPNAPVDDILREMASFASKPAKKAVGQSPAEAMREACAIEIERWAGPGAYVGDDVTKFVKGIAEMVRAVKLPETGGTETAEEDRVIGGGVVLYEGGGYTIRKAGDPFPPTADSYVFVPMYDDQLSALTQSSTPPASKGVEA